MRVTQPCKKLQGGLRPRDSMCKGPAGGLSLPYSGHGKEDSRTQHKARVRPGKDGERQGVWAGFF